MRMRYPCVSDTPLTFLPIFLGKVCLNTQIRQLNSTIQSIDSRSYFYMFCIFLRIYIPHMESLLTTEIPYATLWQHMWHCSIHLFLTLWLIFFGKTFLDTRIGRLNPECYNPGGKNLDSIIRFAFTPIATWSGSFGHLQKSHMQSHIWNHARMFSIFCQIHITHRLEYMESRLKTTHHQFKWCCQLKAVFIAGYWLCVLGNFQSSIRLHWISIP